MKYDDFKVITKPVKKALNKAKAASVAANNAHQDAKKDGRGNWVAGKPSAGYGMYSDHDDGIMNRFVVNCPLADQADKDQDAANAVLQQAVSDLMKAHKSALIQVLSDWADISADLDAITLKHRLHYALQDSVNPTLSNLKP